MQYDQTFESFMRRGSRASFSPYLEAIRREAVECPETRRTMARLRRSASHDQIMGALAVTVLARRSEPCLDASSAALEILESRLQSHIQAHLWAPLFRLPQTPDGFAVAFSSAGGETRAAPGDGR